MVRIHAKSVAHYVDEFDFSGVTNNAQLDFANAVPPVTAFADTDATYVEGKGSFVFNIQGLLDGPYDAEMFIDLTATNRRVGVIPGGGVAGNYGYEGTTKISQQARVTDVNAAIALNVTWRGDNPPVRVVVLDVDTAVGATAQGTAYQRGAAAATDTIVGTLRLLAAPGGAGSNTLDVTIDSDDVENFGGTPETQLTFTQLDQTSVALFEVQSAAGAITDTWWRVDYVYAGGGSRTFSLVITLGIKPT